MFKVIEVRSDELTGNESEHILLKTPSERRANKVCNEHNVTYQKPWFKRQLPNRESFAVVVEIKP